MNTPVSYELAKLLKAKGFGLSKDDYIQLPRFYESDGNYVENHLTVSKKYNPTLDTMFDLGADTINDFEARIAMIDNSLDNIYLAPTIAEVVTWFYEKHNLWISVSCPIKIDPIWFFSIHKVGDDGKDLTNGNYKFNSPTESYEAAIKYALKEVIN